MTQRGASGNQEVPDNPKTAITLSLNQRFLQPVNLVVVLIEFLCDPGAELLFRSAVSRAAAPAP